MSLVFERVCMWTEGGDWRLVFDLPVFNNRRVTRMLRQQGLLKDDTTSPKMTWVFRHFIWHRSHRSQSALHPFRRRYLKSESWPCLSVRDLILAVTSIQSVSQHNYGDARGRGCIAPTHSRPRRYMGVSGQRHAPTVLYPLGKLLPAPIVQSRATAQAVSRRPLTAESRVRAWVNPCGIWGGQIGTGTGFSHSSSGFPCQYHSPVVLHTLISSGGWTIWRLVAEV
jgi:hypothetical protein